MGIASGIATTAAPGGTTTTDATAEQWHIKNGKTAYIASGKVTGNAYTPAMMEFDGSTAYFSDSFTSTGNKVTVVARFKFAAFSGGGFKRIMTARGSGGIPRASIQLFATDYSDADLAGRLSVGSFNTSAAAICFLVTPDAIDPGDDEVHTLFYSFDGDAGTAVFRIDGADADDTGNADRTAPTTGTLQSSASSAIGFGADSDGSEKMPGQIGFCGYADLYCSNWSDFMQTDGSPKNIESTLSTVFGGTPEYWNPHGDMRDNKGSEGAMTQNGTIVVGDGGAT